MSGSGNDQVRSGTGAPRPLRAGVSETSKRLPNQRSKKSLMPNPTVMLSVSEASKCPPNQSPVQPPNTPPNSPACRAKPPSDFPHAEE